MNRNSTPMKKLIVSALLILSCLVGIYAQQSDLSLKVEIQSSTNESNTDGKIIVIVEGGTPDFVFRLLDKAFWEGGTILASSDATNKTEYIFENIKPGKYFISVTDNSEVTQFLFVTVNNE